MTTPADPTMAALPAAPESRISVPPKASPARGLFAASFAIAIFMHAALAMAFLSWRAAHEPGLGATEIDAITVSLVDEVPGGKRQVDAGGGPPQSPAPVEPAPPSAATNAPPVALADRQTPSADVAEGAKPSETEAHTQDGETDQAAAAARARAESRSSPPQVAAARSSAPAAATAKHPTLGGLSSAEAPEPAVERRAAAASSKAVAAFTRSVVAALAQARPRAADRRGKEQKGTVKVRFVVALRGGVELALLAASSGNRDLDHLALEAVRKAAIPQPPAGMTLAQLTYEVPFHFR